MAATSQGSWPLTWINSCHRALVSGRRTRVVPELLAARLPQRASVLDIGCGDGVISSLMASARPDESIHGVEFMVLPGCISMCRALDVLTRPHPNTSVDEWHFMDVLNNT